MQNITNITSLVQKLTITITTILFLKQSNRGIFICYKTCFYMILTNQSVNPLWKSGGWKLINVVGKLCMRYNIIWSFFYALSIHDSLLKKIER